MKLRMNQVGWLLKIINKMLLLLYNVIDGGYTNVDYNVKIMNIVSTILKTLIWRPDFDDEDLNISKFEKKGGTINEILKKRMMKKKMA